MKTSMLFVTAALISFALPAWSDMDDHHDMSKMNMNPSKEDREKMAKAHEEMAACLRTDQAVKACHEALHKEMGMHMHKESKHKK